MQVDFYQLTRDPAEKVVPVIAQRVLDGGGRLLVVSSDGTQLENISIALWKAKPESFLAHAMAGADDDSMQPILLAGEVDAANAARFIALADGEWRDAALAFDRVFYFFAPSHTDNARATWRALAEKKGVERRYWKQNGGTWVQGP